MNSNPYLLSAVCFAILLARANAQIVDRCAPPPSDLIARWTADDTASDSVSGRAGALTNGATYVLGKFGRAFSFDGTNDYLRAGFQISNHLAFTLSAWVNPIPEWTPFGAVVSTRDGNIEYSPRSGFILNIWSDRNGGWTDGTATRYFYRLTNQLPPNAWSHVALTVFSNNTARFFINGTEVPSGSRITDMGQLSNIDTTIGGNYPRLLDFFKGRIDEVRVYNRVLSPAEVALDYVFTPEIRAGIRISAIDICWASCSGRNYQVQYRSDLTTNEWTNLDMMVPGSGETRCVTDRFDDQEKRFYRVHELP